MAESWSFFFGKHLECLHRGRPVSSTPDWHDGSAALILLAQHLGDLISISKEDTHADTHTRTTKHTNSFTASLASEDPNVKAASTYVATSLQFTKNVERTDLITHTDQRVWVCVCARVCVRCVPYNMNYWVCYLRDSWLLDALTPSVSQPITRRQWWEQITKQDRNKNLKYVNAISRWPQYRPVMIL